MNDSHNVPKVYCTDFRCRPDEGPAAKLKRLVKAAGISSLDLDGKFRGQLRCISGSLET